LIEEFARRHQTETLLKLASFPRSSIEDILLRRGVDPDAIDDVRMALVAFGTPMSPEDAVNYSFQRQGSPPRYGLGRFGNGAWPVFYSALHERTCEEEVRHRIGPATAAVPFTRYYQFMACDFRGDILDLRGDEGRYPDLVSATDAGYPFCQTLAEEAIGARVNAFFTRSARNRPDGTCTPVFAQGSLTNPRFFGVARIAI
jgi:hypothetical protein